MCYTLLQRIRVLYVQLHSSSWYYANEAHSRGIYMRTIVAPGIIFFLQRTVCQVHFYPLVLHVVEAQLRAICSPGTSTHLVLPSNLIPVYWYQYIFSSILVPIYIFQYTGMHIHQVYTSISIYIFPTINTYCCSYDINHCQTSKRLLGGRAYLLHYFVVFWLYGVGAHLHFFFLFLSFEGPGCRRERALFGA